MATRATIKMLDHEGERSNVLAWVQDLGDANYSSVTQDVDEIKDAILAITLGNVESADINKSFPESSGFPSTNPLAQREAKWEVTYQDVLQFLDVANTIANAGYLKYFTMEIPTADLSLLPAGSEELDLSAGAGAAFKAAMEPNMRSPYNHSSAHAGPYVTITKVRHIGKNT